MLGFQHTDEDVSDGVIEAAEKLFDIRYPDAYRTIIRDFSGAHGDVEFRVDALEPGFDFCSVGLIYSLLPWCADSIYSVLSSWPEHGLSNRIIPIGEDGAGNYLCFDYRQSKTPKIVFYFHELHGVDGIIEVCDSFAEFLERLTLPDNEM